MKNCIFKFTLFVVMMLTIVLDVTADTWSVANSWGSGKYTRSGDFNGDGITDVASPNGGNIYMKLSTGSSFTSATWTAANSWGGDAWLVAGDFNGDGRDDIASPKSGSVYMKLSTGSGFTSQTWPAANAWGGRWWTFAGDFNGDGLDDIASVNGSNVYVKISTGTGFVSQTWPVNGVWGNWVSTFVGDFNGDGLADLASAYGSTMHMKLSTGSGFTNQTWSAAINSWPNWGFSWAGDFNGDGITDIANRVSEAQGDTIYVRISSGSNFSNGGNWTVENTWGSGLYTKSGDFNGDGVTDVVSFSGGNGYMKFINEEPECTTQNVPLYQGSFYMYCPPNYGEELVYMPLTSNPWNIVGVCIPEPGFPGFLFVGIGPIEVCN